MNNETVSAKELKAIEKDFDFEKLELNLKLPNIFRILKISKTEIRHSNFLAWLLDPNEGHNLRDIFLKRFLLDIEVDFDVAALQNIEIRREWKNIDLILKLENIVVCVENKVGSQEHSNQLARYKKIINEAFPNDRKYFVYLTANREDASDSDFRSYSFEDITEILDQILKIYHRIITQEVGRYIQDYIDILKVEIMKDQEHELVQLANRIYNKHKEALDFIFDKKPDLATEFYKYFETKVKDEGWIIGSPNKGVIRFLTPKLRAILPQLKGWKLKEAFSYELDYYWYNQKQVNFKTTIAEGNQSDEDNYTKKLLSECLSSLPESKLPIGKKWLVHFHRKWKFDLEKMNEKEDNEIYEAIDKFWNEIKEIVEITEAAILTRENEFFELKHKQEA